MENEKELELISLIRKGNVLAESKLIKEYYPKINLIVAMRVKNQDDQMEVVNDILLGIIMKIRDGSFDETRGTPLSHYINGIISNNITQYFKEYYKEHDRVEKIGDHVAEKLESLKQFSTQIENVEDLGNKKAMWRDLIEQLRPKYKKVMYLRFYENKSVIEIGKQMRLSPQKVSDYIKYSKQLLLKEISGEKKTKYFQNFLQIFQFCYNI
jgi:RNA polymerase sigma factor (sigma-70 family)